MYGIGFLIAVFRTRMLRGLAVATMPLLTGAVGKAAVHGLKLVACAVVADAVLGMPKKLLQELLLGSMRQLLAY